MSDVTPGAPDHGRSSPPAGDAGNRVNGRVRDRAGRNGGDHRAADDPRRPARQHLGPGLDDQRLQPGLRGTGLDRYRAGRPVRPPPGLSGRGGAVHTRLGRRRAQPSVASLIAARAALGASGEIATPLSLVLISEAYPLSRRGMVVGAWGAITGIAVGLGPVVGGAIAQGLAWQWVFWLNVPVGLALVAIGRRALAASRGPVRRLDLAGWRWPPARSVFGFADGLLRGPPESPSRFDNLDNTVVSRRRLK